LNQQQTHESNRTVLEISELPTYTYNVNDPQPRNKSCLSNYTLDHSQSIHYKIFYN